MAACRCRSGRLYAGCVKSVPARDDLSSECLEDQLVGPRSVTSTRPPTLTTERVQSAAESSTSFTTSTSDCSVKSFGFHRR
jgi:hypothetical protein